MKTCQLLALRACAAVAMPFIVDYFGIESYDEGMSVEDVKPEAIHAGRLPQRAPSRVPLERRFRPVEFKVLACAPQVG